jgi:hypothetical protein
MKKIIYILLLAELVAKLKKWKISVDSSSKGMEYRKGEE